MGVVNKGCSCIMFLMTVSVLGSVFGCAKSCTQNALKPDSRLNTNAPSKTENFVKETNSGYRSASTSTVPMVPTGSFTINLKALGSCDKNFVFEVKGRDEYNTLKMGVTENGSSLAHIPGTVRFNVVFWDSGNPNKGGLKFQLGFNPNRGCFTDNPDPTLKTIFISQGEKAFVNYISSTGSFAFTNNTPRLQGAATLNRYEISIPEHRVTASSELINLHNRVAKPIEQKQAVHEQKQSIYLPHGRTGR